MTNALTQARADAAEALTNAGFTAVEFIPEGITPPLAVISAGDPYLEQETFTDFTVRLNVRLYADSATNEVVTAALDQMLVDAINNLGDWGIERVGQPAVAQTNENLFLIIDLTITNTYPFEGGS